MSFTLEDDNTITMNGQFKQMELDDTPFAPSKPDGDGAPKRPRRKKANV